MSRIYDNWERLVAATLKREQIWQLCHAQSREPSISSRASDFSFPSPLPNALFDSSSSRQNSVSGAGTSRWGYESSDFEVEKIVNTENPHVSAPEEIFVNGEPLSQEELTVLWCCQHPPKTLKQGYYWYDKVSGFWGKQGQKPSQIISPYLNVGGHLNERASNGNTHVYMNGREITKVELRMLKFAGVRCRPDTRIWIEKDGSYQYEGQNNTAGCIWDKAVMKLLCSLLSLPFPPKSSYASGEQSVPENLEQNDYQKLLLIGCNGSGTSTIFNQAADIFKPHYKPSHMDILYAEAPSLVSSMIFSFPLPYDDDINSVDPKGVFLRYGLTRVSIDGFGDDCKWLEGFVEKGIVIFCISLNDYDLLVMGDNGASVNKMIVARKVFESFVTMCHQINVLLLLTKYDLFEEKIQRIPLNQCIWFNDFNPVKRFYGNKNLGQMGFHYISIKFKRLYTALTGRKLYVAPVNCLKQDSVDAAFKYARDILKWVQRDEETEYYISEESFYSDDE